jgi:hypothetical protein
VASGGLLRLRTDGRDEGIYSILDLMYAKAPYAVIRRAMHIHQDQQLCSPQLSTNSRAVAAANIEVLCEGGSVFHFQNVK